MNPFHGIDLKKAEDLEQLAKQLQLQNDAANAREKVRGLDKEIGARTKVQRLTAVANQVKVKQAEAFRRAGPAGAFPGAGVAFAGAQQAILAKDAQDHKQLLKKAVETLEDIERQIGGTQVAQF